MSGIKPTTTPTPTALAITTPTASGLTTPKAFTVTAKGVATRNPGLGATPGRSRFAKSRPNGADGSRVTHYRSDQPDIPCAPLGRGIPVTQDSRVSPFAITAYPVGVANSADTFTRDQHPDLRARFSRPNGANDVSPGQRPGFYHQTSRALKGRSYFDRRSPLLFAGVQHMLHHLAPNGSMALLLANGSMSSNSNGEGDIRRALIEADLVETAMRECAPLKSEGTPQVVSEARDNMVALPGRPFTQSRFPPAFGYSRKIWEAEDVTFHLPSSVTNTPINTSNNATIHY